MSLIRLSGVTRYYGAEHIVGPVDLVVNPGDRIGLIGPNGSGKSSLLTIMAGTEPDDGEVVWAKDLRIGYLRQESSQETASTLLSYAMVAFEHLAEQERRLRLLEAQMSDPHVQNDKERLQLLMGTYARSLSQFEEDGGYEREARCKSALFGLGFREQDLDRSFTSFSGGERARARLARLLLSPADVLLLDEPTNHLDLASTEWLQSFLSRDQRAFIMVSHDRYLLDALCKSIWEIEDRSVFAYSGNYSTSRQQAVLRRERLLKDIARDQHEREKLEAFVRKWGAGTRASQAKSRARRLEKLGEPAEKPREEIRAHFTVPEGGRSERRVCTLDDVTIGYEDKVILKSLQLEVLRGQRIGIAGVNGSGKSSLLRAIAGELAPLSGVVDMGRAVKVAYYSQHRVDLDPSRTVLDEALEGKDQLIGEARSLLARFLFRGDDVFKPVGVLSGGEKSRLSLAKTLFQGGNLLLLDEPTNHLDIGMAEALEEALADYGGTLLFVTHDRALLNSLAQKIWWVEDQKVHSIDGGYDALQQWLTEQAEKAEESRPQRKTPAAKQDQTRVNQRKIRQMREQLSEIEMTLETLQSRKEQLERVLADPSTYREGDEARELTLEHQELAASLADQEEKWMELVEQLEQLEQLEHR